MMTVLIDPSQIKDAISFLFKMIEGSHYPPSFRNETRIHLHYLQDCLETLTGESINASRGLQPPNPQVVSEEPVETEMRVDRSGIRTKITSLRPIKAIRVEF
jgi:hypothetical protein